MHPPIRAYRPFLLSMFVLIVVYLLGAIYLWQIEKLHTGEHRNNMIEIAASHAYSIERQLSLSLSATYALATMLQIYGELQNFDTLADLMIKSYGGISSLQLAPQGVVTQIYPLKGNERAIGHNLLQDPKRSTEALKTIEYRKLTLAGPFELIQGGKAVIGRLPVFSVDKNGSEHFWGFTIVLIRLTKLLEATQVYSLMEKGYAYELFRIDPDSGKQLVFSRSGEAPLVEPVSFSISVPNGEWTLSISPKSRRQKEPQFYISVVIIGIVGLSFALLTLALMRSSEEIKVKAINLESKNLELQMAVSEIKQLSGLLPICASCKKIRDDKGYWNQIESYIQQHSEAEFSHGMCPVCSDELYGEEDWYKEMKKKHKKD